MNKVLYILLLRQAEMLLKPCKFPCPFNVTWVATTNSCIFPKRFQISTFCLLFLKAVKQKRCVLTPLVYYRHAFKEAHQAPNVIWVTLEMPSCYLASNFAKQSASVNVQKN